jgi:hypothetical protein
MKYKLNSKCLIGGITALVFAATCASAQVIAYDVASNGSFSTGNGGGYGFGTWTLNTPGGGNYVGSDGSNGNIPWFGLWNNSLLPNNYSHATRAFNAALTVGDTFTTSFKNGNLNNNGQPQQAGFRLLDSSGNTLFSYWQQGGNNADGNYSDANGAGTATGFAYDFGTLESYSFTLNSATTYTFTDLAHSVSFSGVLSGAAVDQVQYFRENPAGDTTSSQGGTDFRFYDMQITTVPEPASMAIAGLGGLGLLLALRRPIK